LMVLNEPETSLHPDLLPALARLILAAASQTQIIVVSHAKTLIDALAAAPICTRLHLQKDFGLDWPRRNYRAHSLRKRRRKQVSCRRITRSRPPGFLCILSPRVLLHGLPVCGQGLKSSSCEGTA
jgi:hypothetical protein